MSRLTAFDDAYAESHQRLLLQLYAYCGDADAAEDALDEGFISASRHWHRLAGLETIDGWVRDRAVKRLDSRPQVTRPRSFGSEDNRRLLTALTALDRTSRRLLVVRRLGQQDLALAAREVGLSNASAEQALARASTFLHSAGIDSTPAGLQERLSRLGNDLQGRPMPAAADLERSGTHRRWALTGLLSLALVAVAAGAGAVTATRPLASPPRVAPPTTSPESTGPSHPAMPPLGYDTMLTSRQLGEAGSGTGWRVLPRVAIPTRTSVYGVCVAAAANPPPNMTWVSGYVATDSRIDGLVREVLQGAPSGAEAHRAFRQVVQGFAGCPAHQLVDYATVGGLGKRARMLTLRAPAAGGVVTTSVVIAQSGATVTTLTAASAPGRPLTFSSDALVRLVADTVHGVCRAGSPGCGAPPYPVRATPPPSVGTTGGFLALVDLPLVGAIVPPWNGTIPKTVAGNPSATACDDADFGKGGAGTASSSTYTIPHATKLPDSFGVTETIASFPDPNAARGFVHDVADRVRSCHSRQDRLRVERSMTFSANRTDGRVWELSRTEPHGPPQLVRMALVRRGGQVGQVTFTPADSADMTQAAFIALARRAAGRLRA